MRLFIIKDIDTKNAKDEAEQYIQFLKKLKDNDLEVWNKLQQQIRDSGKSEVANLIYSEMRKQQIETNYRKENLAQYYWSHITGWMTHYGTDFYRPIIYFLMPLFILSSFMFKSPNNITPTYDAMEAFGGYDSFFIGDDTPDALTTPFRQLPIGTPLTYETLCIKSKKEKWIARPFKPNENQLHPMCEGKWGLIDGIELALTYHLPMLSYFVEPAWEARSEPLKGDDCMFRIPHLSVDSSTDDKRSMIEGKTCITSPFKYLTPGHYTFFASFVSWIIIPVYFYGFAARIIRRSEGH